MANGGGDDIGVNTEILFQAASEDPFEVGTRLAVLAQDSYGRIIGAYLYGGDAQRWGEVQHHVNEAVRLAEQLLRERDEK